MTSIIHFVVVVKAFLF